MLWSNMPIQEIKIKISALNFKYFSLFPFSFLWREWFPQQVVLLDEFKLILKFPLSHQSLPHPLMHTFYWDTVESLLLANVRRDSFVKTNLECILQKCLAFHPYSHKFISVFSFLLSVALRNIQMTKEEPKN